MRQSFGGTRLGGAGCGTTGDRDPKNSSSIRRTFHDDLSPVILHDLLYYRKSESRAVLFAVTDKRMKKLIANRFCDARTVVGDRNRERCFIMANRDPNSPVTARRCLASVQQEIVKSSFEFAWIEPCQALAIVFDLNQRSLMAWMQTHGLHCPMYSFHNASATGAERLSGSGKLEQGIDEVGHLVYPDANLLIQLFPLRCRQAPVAEELRVRHNCSQRMTQIVGNGASHASDRG